MLQKHIMLEESGHESTPDFERINWNERPEEEVPISSSDDMTQTTPTCGETRILCHDQEEGGGGGIMSGHDEHIMLEESGPESTPEFECNWMDRAEEEVPISIGENSDEVTRTTPTCSETRILCHEEEGGGGRGGAGIKSGHDEDVEYDESHELQYCWVFDDDDYDEELDQKCEDFIRRMKEEFRSMV